MPTSFCSLCSCLLHTHAKVSSTRFLWMLSPHSLLPELPKLQIFLQGLRLLQLILSRGTFSFFKKICSFQLDGKVSMTPVCRDNRSPRGLLQVCGACFQTGAEAGNRGLRTADCRCFPCFWLWECYTCYSLRNIEIV